MAIEVRQVTITSFVSGRRDEEASDREPQELERIKDEILAECRQLVLEAVRTERER